MKNCILLLGLILGIFSVFLLASATAHADVVFNNFGPNDVYNPEWNYGVAYFFVGGKVFDTDTAMAFTPVGNSYVLEKIELALSISQGSNEIDVWLMNDNGNKPGAIIEAIHLSGAVPGYPGIYPPVEAISSLKPTLVEGVQYWVVVSTPGPLNTTIGWHENTVGYEGLGGQKNLIAGSGNWDIDTDFTCTFRVKGTRTTIYVDGDANGLNSGSSWEDAYNYLKDALAAVEPNSTYEIWVAQGTYRPDEDTGHSTGTGSRTATFQLIDGVALYGGFPSGGGLWTSRDPNTYKTILSGDLAENDEPNFVNRGDNSYHVVTGSGTEPNAILDGFTIAGGFANGGGPPPPYRRGGGMYIIGGSPTVTNCTFADNWATYQGGGIYNIGNWPTFTNCTFTANSTDGDGGGIWSASVSSFTNCTFTGNSAAGDGGGIWSAATLGFTDCTFTSNSADGDGGGIFTSDSSSTVNNCIFVENSAMYGGGVYNLRGDVNVSCCSFSGNTVEGGGGGAAFDQSLNSVVANCSFISNEGFGAGNNAGGLYNINSDTQVIDCLFTNNSAQWGGAVSNINGSSPTITNCTFKDNWATGGCGGINDYNDSDPIIINCILWGNTTPQISNYINCEADVSYSDVQGGWSGPNNIDTDPLFWDAKGHLLNNSPCKNAGDPYGDYSGQTDIDGQPRVMDGGVDIGADELPPSIQNIDTNEVYDTIQQAVNAANNGETIVVQPGTYTGAGNRGINFDGKAITLRSAYPNDLNAVAATIIDCESGGLGVYFASGEDANSVLNGFTITNAYGEGIYGGGINCFQSSPTIKNCILKNNTGYGIYCSGGSIPTIDGGTIRDNSPAGIYIDATSSVLILGTVHIISNDITGEGNLQLGPGGSLDLNDAHVFCSMSGAGTVEVALGAKATIDGSAFINLGDPCNPSIRGTIDCKGTLRVKDRGRITNAKINITKATFEDKACISNCEINVDSKAPYGQVFSEPNTSFVDVNIYADGDRYMDMDPSVFDGNFVNVKIFVRITEGVGKPFGGLLECRGEPNFADVNSCDPNNAFFCLANPGTIPDCNLSTWTLEKLELIEGAKLNLTNRFPFQPPYNPGTDYDVVYVKELILRQGSVLNTSFNHIYYDNLTIEPNAVIKNEPLLGFSMINIALDDQTEFIVRVTHNNYTDPNEPNYSRTHVERVAGSAPDVNGMMIMRNLEDLDPNSGTYLQTIEARAKGLFSKSGEDEIFIRFEYLFGTVDPNTELVIYLSDIPELGDLNEPNDYYEVARLLPPLTGQAGSVGNGKFGVFKEYVPAGGLDFIRGTRVEFRLLGGSGVYMYINNWDPQIRCSIVCLDVTGDKATDVEDFLRVVGSFGTDTTPPAYACLEGPFGENGTTDSGDICGWDWAMNSLDRLSCCTLPLIGGAGTGGGYQLNSFSGAFNDLLVCGKKGTTDGSTKLEDGLYALDGAGQYLNTLTSPSDRANIRLVGDFDGNVYLLNSEVGIRSLDGSEVVGKACMSGVPEPRYGTLANVYVGIQGTGDDSYGRPISDAAFDPDFADNDLVYVVPVVVEPQGQEPYTAAAKLQLSESSYSVVKLYDDPDAGNPADNRQLDKLREIEIDTDGYLYVLNAYSDNQSDILWKYDASSGTMVECLVLGDSGSANYVPSPGAMYMSTAQDMLYLASSLSPPDANSNTICGFSIGGTLTLTRQITVSGIGHVTGITEDPTTGTLWIAGFSMDPPEYPNPSALPFYDPYLAEVPIGSNEVNAMCTSSADPNNDLALPLSIVWTGAISFQQECGGADLDSSGEVDFGDFRIFAQHWYETGCVVPNWCGAADLNPYIRDRKQVDLADLAILSQNWLESGCLN